MIRTLCLVGALKRPAPDPSRNSCAPLPGLPAIFHPVLSPRNSKSHGSHVTAHTFHECLFSLQQCTDTHHTRTIFLRDQHSSSTNESLRPDGALHRNSSKYLLIPKKQTWLNPPTTVTSLQSKGWGEGGKLKKNSLSNRCYRVFPEKRLCEYAQCCRQRSRRVVIFIICCWPLPGE